METIASLTAALDGPMGPDDVDLTRDTLRILFVKDAPEFVELGTRLFRAEGIRCESMPTAVPAHAGADRVRRHRRGRGRRPAQAWCADYVSKTRLTTLVPRTTRALRVAAAARFRAALEARLREREEFFRSLIEASPDGLLVVNQSGHIELVNSEMERMFRSRPLSAAGRSATRGRS